MIWNQYEAHSLKISFANPLVNRAEAHLPILHKDPPYFFRLPSHQLPSSNAAANRAIPETESEVSSEGFGVGTKSS